MPTKKGKRSVIPIHWDDVAGKLTIGARSGSYPGMAQQRTFRIVLVSNSQGVGSAISPGREVRYSGHAVSVTALQDARP